MLQILRGVYNYERESLPFDPTRDIRFLSEAEAEERGCTPEYVRMCRLVRARYVYEFMLTGLILLGGDVISEIGIFDISENNTARLEIEMNQIRYPFTGSCSDGAAMTFTIEPMVNSGDYRIRTM